MSECSSPPSHPFYADRRALISCTRCRRLKKKCKQEGRARCQRCIETDQVCRYDEQAAQDYPSAKVSPPGTPVTKLIFPSVDYEDVFDVDPVPPLPPFIGQSQKYSLLSPRDSPELNEFQFPPTSSRSPSLPPHAASHGPLSPDPDPETPSSQHDNYVGTTYSSSYHYPQQTFYNSALPQNYSPDVHYAPTDSRMMVSNVYSGAQNFTHNAVASSSSFAPSSYSDSIHNHYSGSCYCYQGYQCPYHGTGFGSGRM